MSAAVCGKRASSFFEDQQLPHAASTPPPSKRARLRVSIGGGGSGSPSPPRPRGADPALVAAARARFPAVGLEFIEKALADCENDLDSATQCLLNLQVESSEYNGSHMSKSPVGMSPEGQSPDEGILDDDEISLSVETVPCAENLPSSSTQWVEVLMNEMASASNMDDAKARASRVLEVFEKSMTSHIGAEAHQNFQKENLVYKEQFEAVIRENTILKKAVAIQHERQKEHDERSQELQQLKQLVVQYQEQVRNLEVNNYALSMHLRQAQQGSSIPGHFNRHIF
ncbi:hypothetical protein ACP70R_047031 [Stipagrostis hirtigluma subsp. patula]